MIGRTRMGPVQRVVLGVVCTLVAVGTFFVILMILERFKQNAPEWRKSRALATQLRRTAGRPAGRRAPGRH